jgi:hypothetical protein
MRIPKKFQLGGNTYTVELVEDLAETENLLGYVRYGTSEIKLQTVKKGLLHKKEQEQVFIHELVHAIFDRTLGESHNEAVVQAVASHLHHALTTMEYK